MTPPFPDDPYPQLLRWLAEAAPRSRAAVLATVDGDGRPATRAVIMGHADERGLLFSTYTGSRKGRHLTARPHASATYVWPGRQLTVAGTVELLAEEEAERVFAGRPREVQAAAAVSAQSRPLGDPEVLRRAARELVAGGAEIPRPGEWRCWRLVPYRVEFWEESPGDRIHLSLRYVRDVVGAPWRWELLQP
ncbi:Pyridoxine/pyridoxamine 5'-phosphate oxidase [Streptomyces sp. RB5]|uniref:Pyridoxine/pyridoxamine 5'-phosphate oxidase n=1 Tax=Streptomyces smaragdinus TaxID=2585196 RepID=A0A7K0CW30_9ACTN|nr:pyridoxal 5'-phosphate synthase [Streptomyces smaragdinus]MQY16874.1 Pyridoxine/pyridoxamine 5'-phosphate oxidase [Streptomyces smaragdinus]